MSITYLNHIKSPSEISKSLSNRVKQTRIRRSITQEELAERSGVSSGSVKRFEQMGEISLKHLILISKILRCSEQFDELFSLSNYQSMEELLKEKEKGNQKSQVIEAGVHAGLQVGVCEQIYLEVEEATSELVAYVNKRFR